MNDGFRKRLGIFFGVAAAYFAAGKLGLLLAIPPGYATAVWPPSGIALAAALLAGNVAPPRRVARLLPGQHRDLPRRLLRRRRGPVFARGRRHRPGRGVPGVGRRPAGAPLRRGRPGPQGRRVGPAPPGPGRARGLRVQRDVGRPRPPRGGPRARRDVPFQLVDLVGGGRHRRHHLHPPGPPVGRARPAGGVAAPGFGVGAPGRDLRGRGAPLLPLEPFRGRAHAPRFQPPGPEAGRGGQAGLDRNMEVLYSVESFFAGSRAVERDEFRAAGQILLKRYPDIEALAWNVRVPDGAVRPSRPACGARASGRLHPGADRGRKAGPRRPPPRVRRGDVHGAHAGEREGPGVRPPFRSGAAERPGAGAPHGAARRDPAGQPRSTERERGPVFLPVYAHGLPATPARSRWGTWGRAWA